MPSPWSTPPVVGLGNSSIHLLISSWRFWNIPVQVRLSLFWQLTGAICFLAQCILFFHYFHFIPIIHLLNFRIRFLRRLFEGPSFLLKGMGEGGNSPFIIIFHIVSLYLILLVTGQSPIVCRAMFIMIFARNTDI